MEKTTSTKAQQRLGRLAKALAHPTRLQILHILTQGEACVCHLMTVLGKRQANVSQHLTVLREADLVVDRREGLMVYYSLADKRVAQIIALLRELALDEGDVVFGAVPALPVPGCPCPKCAGADN
ncbi:MAG: winged helix-turn-helix transcriptional regulator [Chloroflexi bacterium]|nr:winged helix-turn-helix transcriptional regulator [Chloroflexota bacterium]